MITVHIFFARILVVKLTADHERLPSHIYNDVTNHRLRAYVRATKHRDHFHNRMMRNKYISSVLIYSYTNTSGIEKIQNCMETRRLKGGVFSYNFEFSRLPRVNVFPTSTENVLYLLIVILK